MSWRSRRDKQDPVEYARAHVTSPGAHALLDEVERGRARRGSYEQQEPEYVTGYSASPGAFTQASLERYVEWLDGFLRTGGRITHVYDSLYTNSRFLVATRDFTTAGECGADAREILVPPGVRHLGGALGHCNLYFEDGHTMQGHFVPAYSDPEFADLPGYAEKAAEEAADRARWEAKRRALMDERAGRVHVSDLSAYLKEGER